MIGAGMAQDTTGIQHAAERAERAADQADRRARDADRIGRWTVGVVLAALLGFVGLAIQNERNAANLRVEIAAVREDLRTEITAVQSDLQGEIAYRMGQLAGMIGAAGTAVPPAATEPESEEPEPEEQ